MQIQEKLRKISNLGVDGALAQIKDELGIKSNLHEDGRVILNYNQIDSPKLDECVRECRGLVLDSNNNWELVARAFPRFFNLGECREEQDRFIWSDCTATDKEDGSLILIYQWKNEWHVNTRGSFGDGKVGDSIWNWRDIVDMALGVNWEYFLNPFYTYVGELCSMYNKVVRIYEKPEFYLLTCFDDMYEVHYEQVIRLADEAGMKLPNNTHVFYSEEQVEHYIKAMGETDSTYEGVVLRDSNNLRIKVKTAEYVALHRMSNNGNIASPKNLIPFILKGEEDEVLTYFPELTDYVAEVKEVMEKAYMEMDNYWYCFHDEKNRKKFALAIQKCKFRSILFKAMDQGVHPREIWVDSPEFIFKVLFKC